MHGKLPSMSDKTTALPIEPVPPQLAAALRESRSAVLIAQPGAEKAPGSLPWENRGRRTDACLMLEPRRLAARSVARYMASRLGEPVGETVGYRIRRDAPSGRAPASR